MNSPSDSVTQSESGDGTPRATTQPEPFGKRSALVMTMPGTAEESAQDTAAVGTEGAPANPKAGPGILWGQLAVALLVLLGLSVATGWWFGWAPGIAAFAISIVAFFLNPVVGATIARARDRQMVVEYRTGTDGGQRGIRKGGSPINHSVAAPVSPGQSKEGSPR